MRAALLLVLVLAGPVWAAPARKVASGVSYATLVFDGVTAHVFRVDLEKVDLRMVAAAPGTRKPVKDLVRALPKVIATNASFFNTDDRAMGLVSGKGKPIVQWSALVIDKAGARIVPARHLGPDAASVVVQGMPRLVIGGRVEHLKEQVARRTAVCADGKQLTLIVTTGPAEFNAFARFLAAPVDAGGAGCIDALNLDGGPSTQLITRVGDLTLALDGQPVPNALTLIPRP